MRQIYMIPAIVRDCISPVSIQLGTTSNPVTPKLNCTMEDISYGKENIQACLCTLPFCNHLSLESIKSATFKPNARGRSNEKSSEHRESTSRKELSEFQRSHQGFLINLLHIGHFFQKNEVLKIIHNIIFSIIFHYQQVLLQNPQNHVHRNSSVLKTICMEITKAVTLLARNMKIGRMLESDVNP